MDKRTELYLATLATKKRIVVSIDKEYDMPIGEKKKAIIKDLNAKLGAEIVQFVTFYGYADVKIKDGFLKHKRNGTDK